MIPYSALLRPAPLPRRQTNEDCAACLKPIAPGYAYVVGPPVVHVSCPAKPRWTR